MRNYDDKFVEEIMKERVQLKQQLAEKDQAIESLQEINQSLGQTCNNDAKEIERLREALYKAENVKFHEYQPYMTHTEFCAEQLKNQTAIEVLEKVLKFMKTENELGFKKSVMETFMFIDQQIKELKGE